MFSNILAFVLHLPVSYIFGVHYKMGLEGVAYSTSLHFVNRLIVITIFIKFSKFNKHLMPIFAKESFINLKP